MIYNSKICLKMYPTYSNTTCDVKIPEIDGIIGNRKISYFKIAAWLFHDVKKFFKCISKTCFFICYLAAPQPTLYHCRGGSLINLILIIEFDTCLTWKSLLASYWGWVQKPSWAPGGLLTEIPLILNVGL